MNAAKRWDGCRNCSSRCIPGRVAFVSGEAGIGKTSLLRVFTQSAAFSAARPLWGACDPLHTPRPLGALHDMAADMGVGVRTALTRDAGRLEIFAAVLDALGREARCVVFEDLHWADEATLDLLAYLGRRIDEARVELARATAHRHVWLVGELSWWLWRAGVAVELPDAAAAVPYALQIAGRWREAATAWRGLACPFEAARSLAEGDADSQLEALSIFEGLGARPAADALRQRLHAAGVRGLVRGPRTATRAHPFSLTARELQVLQLLCKGLRNAEIAQQLSRSVRTVDHHLAAVFAKLGVDSRVAAIQAAQRAGLQTPARQSGPPVPPR